MLNSFSRGSETGQGPRRDIVESPGLCGAAILDYDSLAVLEMTALPVSVTVCEFVVLIGTTNCEKDSLPGHSILEK